MLNLENMCTVFVFPRRSGLSTLFASIGCVTATAAAPTAVRVDKRAKSIGLTVTTNFPFSEQQHGTVAYPSQPENLQFQHQSSL